MGSAIWLQLFVCEVQTVSMLTRDERANRQSVAINKLCYIDTKFCLFPGTLLFDTATFHLSGKGNR